MAWYAFQVKDSYNRMSQYKEIIAMLQSERYKKTPEEFFVAGDGKRDNSICNYVFIKVDGNILQFWEQLSQEKYFMTSMGYIEIPDDQMSSMINTCRESENIDVHYGDIVYIENGPYRKLYGIVLDVKDGKFEVGLNLCIGQMIVTLKPENVRIEKSLFEIWKFPR